MKATQAGGGRHGHLSSEDLVEFALELSAGRMASDSTAVQEVRACSLCNPELERTLADLQRVRGALLSISASDHGAAARIANATLGLTTREDLSWRGDWRVVGRFLQQRWGASVAVRLLAASLLLHLLALPVLAIVLVVKVREARPMWITVERPLDDLPVSAAPVEPRRELVREPEPATPGPMGTAPDAPERSTRLTRARRQLLDCGAPALADRGEHELRGSRLQIQVARLLLARSQRLGLGAFDASRCEPRPQASTLERALWAELLLDDWALSGRPDPRLADTLGTLESNIADQNADTELARHALLRAASYGLPGTANIAEPRPALDRPWFEALERALAFRGQGEAGGADDPEGPIARWLAWGRANSRP